MQKLLAFVVFLAVAFSFVKRSDATVITLTTGYNGLLSAGSPIATFHQEALVPNQPKSLSSSSAGFDVSFEILAPDARSFLYVVMQRFYIFGTGWTHKIEVSYRSNMVTHEDVMVPIYAYPNDIVTWDWTFPNGGTSQGSVWGTMLVHNDNRSGRQASTAYGVTPVSMSIPFLPTEVLDSYVPPIMAWTVDTGTFQHNCVGDMPKQNYLGRSIVDTLTYVTTTTGGLTNPIFAFFLPSGGSTDPRLSPLNCDIQVSRYFQAGNWWNRVSTFGGAP